MSRFLYPLVVSLKQAIRSHLAVRTGKISSALVPDSYLFDSSPQSFFAARSYKVNKSITLVVIMMALTFLTVGLGYVVLSRVEIRKMRTNAGV